MTDMHGKELKVGQRVRIYALGRAVGTGYVLGGFPQDPQGLPGAITVDVGMGCHEYATANRLEIINSKEGE